MKHNDVVPGVGNFNILINSLVCERDLVAAQHVYDVDMPEAEIAPDDRTIKMMARVSEVRTKKLKTIFDRQGEDAARQLFEEMQRSSLADLFQYGWAMKELCQTSNESRALMETMKQNGVVPNVVHFTMLIRYLLDEGELVAAQHVYGTEMPASGIEPDDRTMGIMAQAEAQADELASKGLTFKLKNILERQGKDAALEEFEKMQKSGHANNIHYSWAMKELCEISNESRALMESMSEHGCFPDVTTFTILINNLLYDGEIDKAQHVFDVEMPAAGIAPNNITIRTMAQADKLASMGRKSQQKRKKNVECD